MGDVDVDRAAEFIWRNARLLERHMFARRFLRSSGEHAAHVLRSYQNDDGGFGNALEPDLRGPDSQPIHVDTALRVMREVGVAPPEMVSRACSYLVSVTGDSGGVPAILPSAARYPRAGHWQPSAWISDSLNPTAM